MPPTRRRERKKERTREAIAKAATTLFLTKGFDATTVDDIAVAADIAPRTFFRYFPTKEDVIFGQQRFEDQAVVAAIRRRSSTESDLDALLRALSEVPLGLEGPNNPTDLIRLIRTTPALLARGAAMVAGSVERIATALAVQSRSGLERRRAHLLVGAYVGSYLARMLSDLQSGTTLDLDVIGREVRAGMGRRWRESPRPSRGRSTRRTPPG